MKIKKICDNCSHSCPDSEDYFYHGLRCHIDDDDRGTSVEDDHTCDRWEPSFKLRQELEYKELEAFCKELMKVVEFYGDCDPFVGYFEDLSEVEILKTAFLVEGKRAREIQKTEMYKRLRK